MPETGNMWVNMGDLEHGLPNKDEGIGGISGDEP